MGEYGTDPAKAKYKFVASPAIPEGQTNKDIALSRVESRYTPDDALRRINMICGTYLPKEGTDGYDAGIKEQKEIDGWVAAFLDSKSAYLVGGGRVGRQKGSWGGNLHAEMHFQAKLLDIFLAYKGSDMEYQLSRVVVAVKDRFRKKYPAQVDSFTKEFGDVTSIKSVIEYVKKRNAQELPPGLIREYFSSPTLDTSYSIDLIDVTYNPTAQNLVIDEMDLVQVKSSLQTVQISKIASSHRAFMRQFLIRAKKVAQRASHSSERTAVEFSAEVSVEIKKLLESAETLYLQFLDKQLTVRTFEDQINTLYQRIIDHDASLGLEHIYELNEDRQVSIVEECFRVILADAQSVDSEEDERIPKFIAKVEELIGRFQKMLRRKQVKNEPPPPQVKIKKARSVVWAPNQPPIYNNL